VEEFKMALIRFIFFILAISVVVGLVAKYLILFLRKAKKTEEKVYDKLEEKILPKEKAKPKTKKKK
jgi:hypothetical protein